MLKYSSEFFVQDGIQIECSPQIITKTKCVQFDILVTRFNEVPQEGVASLGIVTAVAQVVYTARQRHVCNKK